MRLMVIEEHECVFTGDRGPVEGLPEISFEDRGFGWMMLELRETDIHAHQRTLRERATREVQASASMYTRFHIQMRASAPEGEEEIEAPDESEPTIPEIQGRLKINLKKFIDHRDRVWEIARQIIIAVTGHTQPNGRLGDEDCSPVRRPMDRLNGCPLSAAGRPSLGRPEIPSRTRRQEPGHRLAQASVQSRIGTRGVRTTDNMAILVIRPISRTVHGLGSPLDIRRSRPPTN